MTTNINLSVTEHDENIQTGATHPYLRRAKCSSLRPDLELEREIERLQDIERRHTGLGSAIANNLTFLEAEANLNKLRKWRYESQRGSSTESRAEILVDGHLSQNSFEIKVDREYVSSWLDEGAGDYLNLRRRYKSWNQFQSIPDGNTLEVNRNTDWHSESSLGGNLIYNDRYENLREDFARLRSDYWKVRSKISHITKSKLNDIIHSKADNLSDLKNLIIEQARLIDSKSVINNGREHQKDFSTVRGTIDISDQELINQQIVSQLEFVRQELERQNGKHISELGSLQSENVKLIEEIKLKNEQVESLKKRIEELTAVLENRDTSHLVDLQRENSDLKQTNERERAKLESIGYRYKHLSEKFELLCKSQGETKEENQIQLARLRAELCSLEDKITQLEGVLEAESETKERLENNLDDLQTEKSRLEQEICHLRRDACRALIDHETLTGSEESEAMRDEVSKLMDRNCSLEVEKKTLELQMKRMNQELITLDQELLDKDRERQSGLDKRELDSARLRIVQLEAEKDMLSEKVSQMVDDLRRVERESDELRQEISEMEENHRMVIIEAENERAKLVHEHEKMACELRLQLENLVSESSKLKEVIEIKEKELCEATDCLNNLKSQFKAKQVEFSAQQKAHENEISGLRSELNLERYRRRIMKHDIESELKMGLNELELMRNRLTRTLSVTSDLGRRSRCQTHGSSEKCHRKAGSKKDESARKPDKGMVMASQE